MSSTTEHKGSADKGRVAVEDLPRKDEELAHEDAAQIKGGGGAAASGVNWRRPGGEEIPQ